MTFVVCGPLQTEIMPIELAGLALAGVCEQVERMVPLCVCF